MCFMVDLRRLRALRAVADHGTLAAAADSLHLTPSAVSQQLAALERDVQRPLLEPNGRTVRLTAAARVLLDHADTLFAQLERLEGDLAAGDDALGEIRVVGFPTALAGLLAPAARTLRAEAPGVTLRILELETPEAADAPTRTGDAGGRRRAPPPRRRPYARDGMLGRAADRRCALASRGPARRHARRRAPGLASARRPFADPGRGALARGG